ncbi:FHA domain-containing protein [Inhella gelatinilytica]|uniref:FHA domain-containing protein n=1 Tax=Inhella gelatinilytica TaxID=2795030 RepID=A0A931NCT0_9BURK|nr:FHA domain-containing protein [Inhella gelatinilytica]MBH9552347.1 FHA domain-containing protein [Inhella gelatinilytica]
MKPLALIDVMDGDVARHSVPVFADAQGGATLCVGRSLDCDVVLDDPHVAAVHAQMRVEATPVARLTLLPSLNGGWLGTHPLRGGTTVDWQADTVVQLGQSRLRLRHAAAAVAPETPPVQAVAHHRWAHRGILPLLILICLLWFGGEQWLRSEPGTPLVDYARPLLGVGLGALLWAGVWALVTQVFQRRFPFGAHLQRTLWVVVLAAAADEALAALAFVGSWPALLSVAEWLGPIALATLAVWQGQLALPRRQQWVRGAALLGFLVWMGMSWVSDEGVQHRWRPPYMAGLLPPEWRLAPLRSVDALLEEAERLEPELAAKAKRDPKGREESQD